MRSNLRFNVHNKTMCTKACRVFPALFYPSIALHVPPLGAFIQHCINGVVWWEKQKKVLLHLIPLSFCSVRAWSPAALFLLMHHGDVITAANCWLILSYTQPIIGCSCRMSLLQTEMNVAGTIRRRYLVFLYNFEKTWITFFFFSPDYPL